VTTTCGRGSNDYSVHPVAVGRRVEVRADLERIQAFCDGRLVADHGRCWARHQTISDPAHLAAAAQLRHQRAVLGHPSDAGEVQLRCLTDYDAALGLHHGQGWPDGGHDGPDLTAELAFLTRALKAPTLRQSVARLAERARAEGWTHEEFLAACLQREVAAGQATAAEAASATPAPGPQVAGRVRPRPRPQARPSRPPGHAGLRHRTGERGLPRPTWHRQDSL
jgi:Mu transposase, C-terminal domain